MVANRSWRLRAVLIFGLLLRFLFAITMIIRWFHIAARMRAERAKIRPSATPSPGRLRPGAAPTPLVCFDLSAKSQPTINQKSSKNDIVISYTHAVWLYSIKSAITAKSADCIVIYGFCYKIMDISSVLEALENDGRVYSCGLASGVEIQFEHSQPNAIVIFDLSDQSFHV